MQHRQPGNNCNIGRPNRIVFDQFGNLYAGYDMVGDADVSKGLQKWSLKNKTTSMKNILAV